MRWYAAFLFLWPSFCDKRVKVESQPPERGVLEQVTEACRFSANNPAWGTRSVIRIRTCNHVTEIFERFDGMRYTKEYDDCMYDLILQGRCT